ncbi:hypothetical protein EDB19DRAFT_1655064 [Suillus lakei]|nr:hypothetical protein EDB19DRAFT_1655064 [Suillus lakei]
MIILSQAIGGAFAAKDWLPSFVLVYIALAAEFLLCRKYNGPFRHQVTKFGKGQRSMYEKIYIFIHPAFCTSSVGLKFASWPRDACRLYVVDLICVLK